MGEVYTGKYKNVDLSKYNTQGLQTLLTNLQKSGTTTQDQKDYLTSVQKELSKRGVATSSSEPEQKTILFGLLALGLFVWFYKRNKK